MKLDSYMLTRILSCFAAGAAAQTHGSEEHSFRVVTMVQGLEQSRAARTAWAPSSRAAGSGYVAAEQFEVEAEPSHGFPCRLRLSLPPLAAVSLRPGR